MSSARTLLVLAAVAAFAVVGTLAFAFVSQNRVDVYFDNGLPKRVSVSVDGEVFPLGNAEPKRRSLAPGIHQVVVSDDTGRIESARIEIVKKDLMGAFLDREFYVYNVAQAHIYRRAHHVYAVAESDLARVGFDAEADFYRALVDLLRGRASEGEALTAAREAGFMMLPHAYFLFGAHVKSQGNEEAASAYFRRSAATAVTLDFPYLAAKSEGKPLHQK